MERDFRRRCEAALTHPITLAALAALVVNDVVFKALFPGAWAVGKLSDLAWVVFASPLLAFALSFAVPTKSAAGRRAALIVAYGGLPLLYAAFNAFAPVHDAIMRVLLIGADGAARGSPMDATDSLVIPFGLALAAWAWRLGAKSNDGLRPKFAALIAGIAALASVASSMPLPVDGVAGLGATDDGAILASASAGYGYYPVPFRSEDGGMSWSPDDSDVSQLIIQYSSRAQTPRGEYISTDSGVERLDENGQRELVYSTEYLRGDANRWMQEKDTQELAYRFLTERPKSILYHADSGSVIVAMGLQGAVVGTADGHWHRVAVGPYSPTDFSFSAKTRALLDSGWTVGAIALALSLSALTTAAAASAYEYKNYREDRERDLVFVILTASGCLGAICLLIAANMAKEIGVGVVFMSVAALVSWITGIIAASKSDGGAQWRFALLACVSTLPISIGLLFSFGFSDAADLSYDGFISYTDYYNPMIMFAAFASLISPLAYYARFIARRWRAFAPAFLGMIALVALSFALWLQMNLSLAATQTAIVGLVGLAAVVLVRHVRAGLRADPDGTPRAPMAQHAALTGEG